MVLQLSKHRCKSVADGPPAKTPKHMYKTHCRFVEFPEKADVPQTKQILYQNDVSVVAEQYLKSF